MIFTRLPYHQCNKSWLIISLLSIMMSIAPVQLFSNYYWYQCTVSYKRNKVWWQRQYEPRREKTTCICETKTQISFAVTAKLISAFVFAIRIVQFLFYLNLKFQASSYLLWLYSPVCVGPGRKPQRPVFSEQGSYRRLNFQQ